MNTLSERFSQIITHNPSHKINRNELDKYLVGDAIHGEFVNFVHADVEAHKPIPGSLERFVEGFVVGGNDQAYTANRGTAPIRDYLASKLSAFYGTAIDPETELIITPGTQGALFCAMGSLVDRGDKVAFVEPDYHEYRPMVSYFGCEAVPIPLHWKEVKRYAGIDLELLEKAFQGGVKLFVYSNPNNPTGVIYSPEEVAAIGRLAKQYNVAVIADELYSRLVYDKDILYTHLRTLPERPDALITIIGPSKTESMSGFRVGVAFGPSATIDRMEKLLLITSIRPAGYCQSVLLGWFSEPEGWLEKRIEEHRAIRDDLVRVVSKYPNCWIRPIEGGSFTFLQLPKLNIPMDLFIDLCRAHADVAVSWGIEFGVQFSDFVRLNISQDHKNAVAALDRLCQMAQRYLA